MTQSFPPPPSALSKLYPWLVSNGNVNTQIQDLDSYANEYFSQQTKIVERFSEVAPGNLRKSVTAIQKELLKLTYIFTQERLGNKRSL